MERAGCHTPDIRRWAGLGEYKILIMVASSDLPAYSRDASRRAHHRNTWALTLPMRTLAQRRFTISRIALTALSTSVEQFEDSLESLDGSSEVGVGPVDMKIRTESERLGALGCPCKVPWLMSITGRRRAEKDAVVDT